MAEGLIKWLKKKGQIIVPQTLDSAVLDEDGKPIKDTYVHGKHTILGNKGTARIEINADPDDTTRDGMSISMLNRAYSTNINAGGASFNGGGRANYIDVDYSGIKGSYAGKDTFSIDSTTGEAVFSKVKAPMMELLDYSTEEQLTGKRWIDGKPIYQLTFLCNDRQTRKTVSNVENIVYAQLSNHSDADIIMSTGVVYESGQNQYINNISYNKDGSYFFVNIGTAWSFAGYANVTVQYTKTTDSPDTDIVMPNATTKLIMSDLDYSEEEQLTGKRWIDGKPLYQKVYMTNGNTFDIGDLNPDFVQIVQTITYCSDGGAYMNDGAIPGANAFLLHTYSTSRKAIYLEHGVLNILRDIVVLQYTKTTDTASSPVKAAKQHVYDDKEKIVGTWFGKTLYEYSFTLIPTGVGDYYNVPINNVDVVRNIEAVGIRQGGWHVANNYQAAVNNNYSSVFNVEWNPGEKKIYLLYGSGTPISKAYVTLQYTKTTD